MGIIIFLLRPCPPNIIKFSPIKTVTQLTLYNHYYLGFHVRNETALKARNYM